MDPALWRWLDDTVSSSGGKTTSGGTSSRSSSNDSNNSRNSTLRFFGLSNTRSERSQSDVTATTSLEIAPESNSHIQYSADFNIRSRSSAYSHESNANSDRYAWLKLAAVNSPSGSMFEPSTPERTNSTSAPTLSTPTGVGTGAGAGAGGTEHDRVQIYRCLFHMISLI